MVAEGASRGVAGMQGFAPMAPNPGLLSVLGFNLTCLGFNSICQVAILPFTVWLT